MSFSPSLSSGFARTETRSKHITPSSGMCSMCTEDCGILCDLGLAAVRGAQTVYPTTTGANQIAGEKEYPLDYSHFNINGHVFGATGAEPDYESAEIFNVDLGVEYGTYNKVKMALPLIQPAIIKLAWRDYFAGAAMAGITCVVGEDAKGKDPDLKIEDGKITDFPMLGEIIGSFKKYYRGYGQIVPQCNVEDDMLGIPEYAIKEYKLQAIEFKYGQSAKGTQPARRLNNREEALEKQNQGMIVLPDPMDPEIIKKYEKGICPNFDIYTRLPLWDEEYMLNRIGHLRELGLKNTYFKMTGYDRRDIERVIRLGSQAQVDMITFDGAGGGSGYSPCKMMNEWGLPTILLEEIVCGLVEQLKREGAYIPAISITGGFTTEDHVFKALAFGNQNIAAAGLCRASMTAAMTGKNIGERIKAGNIPKNLQKFGNTVDEIYHDLADLRSIYGKEADSFSLGAVGVFSYLNKLAFGLKHFAALNRKFDVKYLDRSDLIPLTREANNLIKGNYF